MIVEKKNKSQALNTFPNELNAEISLNRIDAPYENLSGRFRTSDKDFAKQFAHVYAGRLSKSKGILQKKCLAKWGKAI